jgi:hypothetical protein
MSQNDSGSASVLIADSAEQSSKNSGHPTRELGKTISVLYTTNYTNEAEIITVLTRLPARVLLDPSSLKD